MTEPGRARRRHRRPAGERSAATPTPQAVPQAPAGEPPAPKRRRSGGDRGPRDAMRDISGAGRSSVGVDGALRARDVNRPTEEDLAAAEREVQLVRRHWTPPKS